MAGSVRKRNNKWYYSFEAGTVDGKRKRIERVGGRTKKEAEAALRKAMVQYENSGLHFEPNDISYADYLEYWFEHYVLVNCKYRTQEEYRKIIDGHLKPALGKYKLKSLTPAVLQELINSKYINGYSKNYLGNMMNVLKGSIKYAVHPLMFIQNNPGDYIKMPKYEHSKLETNRKVITQEEFKLISERFPEGSTFYIPIMIGYYTGARIGEVMALTWDDIDLKEATISIDKIIQKRKKYWYFGSTKTKSSNRKIKIGNALVDILKSHKKSQMENRLKYGPHYILQFEATEETSRETLRRIYTIESGLGVAKGKELFFVCSKENGEMVTTETFKYASKVINYSLGIEFNFHALRHTHATILIENGANIKDVQLRLGHAKISTTLDTYTHATKKMSEDTAALFDAVNK